MYLKLLERRVISMEKQKIFTFEQQKELFKNNNNRVLSFDSV